MNRPNATSTRRTFLPDEAIVVLYDGRYNGMPGHFVELRSDPNWADIRDHDGISRPHPVAWLRRPDELPSAAALLAEDAARN